MIEDRHRVAALMHVTHRGDPTANVVSVLDKQIWDLLVREGFIFKTSLGSYVVTMAGRDYLQRLLR